MTNPTINSIELTGTTEQHSRTSGLLNSPLPLSNSDESLIMDLFGTGRTITVTGLMNGTPSELSAFIVSIEAIQNGAQTGATFVSGKNGLTYTVLIDNFDWTDKGGAPGILDYTLILMEGSVI